MTPQGSTMPIVPLAHRLPSEQHVAGRASASCEATEALQVDQLAMRVDQP
jgi:hypothetical protein